MPQKTIKAATNSFVMSNFNDCPLTWHFTTAKSRNKIEKINERALKLSNDGYNNNTYEEMLAKSDSCTMEVGRLKNLCTEIYKTLHGLNPPYVKDIFQKPINRTSKRLGENIYSAKHYQINFGTRSAYTSNLE